MTNYFTYDKNGNYTKSTSRPESGYYTAQERPGGEVILYEANPGGDPKKIDSWDRPNKMDYVLTPEGDAYKVKQVDNVYRADPGKRDDKHDRKPPASSPPPSDEDQKKKYMEGLEKDPEKGDSFDDFALKIKLPPGSPSDDLTNYISLANHQLKYLEKQMGDKKKPLALASPEKGKDTLLWDNNLSKSFTDAMGHGGEAQAGGKGEAVDAYKSASAFLDELDAQWSARDDDFKTENLKLTADNDRTYRKMWDKVQSAHEDIWAALKKPHAGYFGGSNFSKDNFTAAGIQNVVEEAPVYGIVRETVQFCVEQVVEYANRAESAGKKFGDFPGFPGDKGDGTGDGKSDTKGDDGKTGTKGDDGKTGTKGDDTKIPIRTGDNGNSYTGAYPGQYTGAQPPGQATTAQQAGQDESFKPLYDDLLGTDTDTTGSVDSTQPTIDSGTASSADIAALQNAAQQGGSGTGAGTTATTPTATTATPVSNTGSAGGSDMSNLMGQMAMMNALQGSQARQPISDDRGYDDDRDSRHERDRARERERAAQAAATQQQQTVQASPTGVTAPTYAGSPPPVTTPGTTVDVPIDNTNVKASPPVAEALQKQVQNVALDAISAYKGTVGELSADHPPAMVNGPGELKTGDILQWERHSALVVRDQENNKLFVLDGGHLVPLDPNDPPLKEKYGNFAGYIHPTGLDSGNPELGTSAAAPPPPTVSQAQPTAPPAVTPPKEI